MLGGRLENASSDLCKARKSLCRVRIDLAIEIKEASPSGSLGENLGKRLEYPSQPWLRRV